jgi:hypothetical protein
MSSCYTVEYRRRFAFDASPEILWAALEDFWSWGELSTWVWYLEVHGQGLSDLTVVCATVATPVGHAMRVVLELERCVPVELIVATVSGDLMGEGRLLLQGDNGGTRAEVASAFEMLPRSLRAVARVAGPVLRWGHNVLAESTIETFKAPRLPNTRSDSFGESRGGLAMCRAYNGRRNEPVWPARRH